MEASQKRFSRLAVAASVAALSLSAAADTRFWSDVGDRSTRVMVRYADDHIDARRDAGMRISLR